MTDYLRENLECLLSGGETGIPDKEPLGRVSFGKEAVPGSNVSER
jgi:hypothetical protein